MPGAGCGIAALSLALRQEVSLSQTIVSQQESALVSGARFDVAALSALRHGAWETQHGTHSSCTALHEYAAAPAFSIFGVRKLLQKVFVLLTTSPAACGAKPAIEATPIACADGPGTAPAAFFGLALAFSAAFLA